MNPYPLDFLLCDRSVLGLLSLRDGRYEFGSAREDGGERFGKDSFVDSVSMKDGSDRTDTLLILGTKYRGPRLSAEAILACLSGSANVKNDGWYDVRCREPSEGVIGSEASSEDDGRVKMDGSPGDRGPHMDEFMLAVEILVVRR